MSGLEIISKVQIKESNGFWLIFAFCAIVVLNILFCYFLYKRENKGKETLKSSTIITISVVINLIIMIPCCFLSWKTAVSTDRYSYVAKITDTVDFKEFSEKYDHIVFNDDGTVSFEDKKIDN